MAAYDNPTPALCSALVQRDYLSHTAELKNRESFPGWSALRNWGEVGVMLFHHPCVGMAELSSNDGHRAARHGKIRSVRVPQDVKVHRRLDLGSLTRLIQRPLLVRRAPDATVIPQEISFTKLISQIAS